MLALVLVPWQVLETVVEWYKHFIGGGMTNYWALSKEYTLQWQQMVGLVVDYSLAKEATNNLVVKR
jgi:hypothetical protein